ncbi:hypothetical protein Scep_004195 [Stephania cephalantha]|uniref:Uncharacterized protein n=1 Tax=Stephania cephalantha TaxID=152367 RepID=A0AAP0KS40_9MAGN
MEFKQSVAHPLLISDGSDTELKRSFRNQQRIRHGMLLFRFFDLLLISNGSETECMNFRDLFAAAAAAHEVVVAVAEIGLLRPWSSRISSRINATTCRNCSATLSNSERGTISGIWDVLAPGSAYLLFFLPNDPRS